MTYNCPLRPPHVGEDGQPMLHKSRRECMNMGLNNRGTETHPEKFTNSKPPAKASPPPAPASDNVASPPASGAGSEGSTPSVGTSPPKRGKFTIFKKTSGASPEKSPENQELAKKPEWTGQLSGDLTVRFWTTIASFGKMGVEYLDKLIKAKEPYDTKNLEFTTSEEQMISDVMPGVTTKIVKGLGAKSLEEAERVINGLVILRVFGRIFVGLGAHYVKEFRAKQKDKPPKPPKTPRAPPEAPPVGADEAKGKEEPRAEVSAPAAEARPRHPTPAQMERMNMIAKAIVPKGAQ